MTPDVALILALDGLGNGAVYLLAGLGLVLIFSVTRVVFVPFGDVAAIGALSLAAMEAGRLPPTIGLVATLAVLAAAVEGIGRWRSGRLQGLGRAVVGWGLLPLIPCAAAWLLAGSSSTAVRVVVALGLVLPIAPLIARIALQPIADGSVLVLLIVSLALHFLLSGLALLFFGPEGFRIAPLLAGTVRLGAGLAIAAQQLLMIGAAGLLALLLYLLFEHTRIGKVLRATAVNRTGARLMAIRPARAALFAWLIASLMAGVIGVLIAPVMTVYYDSGFLIGLKAFVAAMIGGLVAYPLTALGAMAVGIVESFASFWSSALRDVLVFSLLIPVLMLRSWLAPHGDEPEEDLDQ
ncbi:MAG TPA: branched-chain amino acid ABC transporter permease [Burkholderiaceae bacterium]|nr:branched-chain amino acid ABC transporter permease [Burkholderiaceae bacterium]